MNQTLVNIFTFLEGIGLVDVLLPFILVFVIVYGVLEKTKVLGKESRNANAIAAMVMGFMIVAAINYVNIINDMVRIFGLLVVMVLAFALIYGLFGRDMKLIKPAREKVEKKKGSDPKPARPINNPPAIPQQISPEDQEKLQNDFMEFLNQKYSKPK